MSQKLWKKNQSEYSETESLIHDFTTGNDREFDLLLAKYDVLSSAAHAQMLSECGLITHTDFLSLNEILNEILSSIENSNFEIPDSFEDVHSRIEFLLTEKLGDTGKKIHTARSRNDQVFTDIKWFLKDQIIEIANSTQQLFNTWISQSKQYKNVLMPGFTHYQAAMISSFGIWFSAYAESLSDDLELLISAYRICDKSPLGTAAGFGSSFPINRNRTSSLMGFSELDVSPVYAQISRGKTEKNVAIAIAGIAFTLSKFANDVCLYMNQNFALISLPAETTTGSSIMPHKKNPDVFELIRAKCNRLQVLPQELSFLITNLPSGYHRDFQLTKETLFPAIKAILDCLEICNQMSEKMLINSHALEDKKYDVLYSVEQINCEVLNGLPFREAYMKVASDIENGHFFPDKNVNHTHEGSIGNLMLEKIRELFEKRMLQLSGQRA